MRMGVDAGRPQRARRRLRGRASSTWPTASSSARRRSDATGVLEGLWKDGVGDLGRPARRGDGHRRRGRPLRRALPRGARRPARGLPPPARAAAARGRLLRRDPAREPLGEGRARSRRCCAPTRPSAASATPPPRLRDLLRHAREVGAHLHIDMESFDSREAVTDLVLELLAEDEFRDGPSAGLVLQAYLRDSPEPLERLVAWARASRARAAARRPARQGRLLGPRGRRGAPARLGARRCSRSRPSPTATSRR